MEDAAAVAVLAFLLCAAVIDSGDCVDDDDDVDVDAAGADGS